MNLIIVTCVLSLAAAAKLGPNFQPPRGSENAGGFPGDISAPFGQAPKVIEIIDQQFESSPDGSYNYRYETENGIKAQETGVQKEAPEGPGTSASGSYSYPGPDGTLITVTYTADENGFVAEGDHLPTAPPIPAAIYRSLLIADETNAQVQAGRTPFRGLPANYRFGQN